MASVMGNKLKLSVFGQSHSAAIGGCIDGLPAGLTVDMGRVLEFMKRRAPGQNAHSTARKEADMPIVLSGLSDNVTCGAPLAFMIENTNTRSGDYANLRDVPRPGHADFTAAVKYGGFQDVAGGGHFSGRLTAPICFAGAVCIQALEQLGVSVRAHVYSVAGIPDVPYDPINVQTADTAKKAFPVLSDAAGEKMQTAIQAAKRAGDSVGGVIECAVTGLPAGLGDPMFDGAENQIARNIFGIPAVKGIEFGNGFAAAALRGSENNDPFYTENGEVKTKTNNHGGILGGITSGMPLVFRVAIKPTPSVALEQDSVSLSKKTNEKLSITGRHDPCIVPRAVPVVEAVAAITVFDMILQEQKVWNSKN